MVFDKDKKIPDQYNQIKVKDCCVWVGMCDIYIYFLKQNINFVTLVSISNNGTRQNATF